MAIQHITPEDAHALLQGETEFVYLDVRSVPEFDQGHPEGAYNIPLMNFDHIKQRLSPNPEFQRVVQVNFRPDQKIIVGCKSGGRSLKAAELLEGLGYTLVCNVVGGFAGGEDELGEPVKGWADCNLPVSRMALSGKSYESMLENAT